MTFFEELERRVDAKLRQVFATRETGEVKHIVEVQHTILQAVGGKVQSATRGRRIFPYDRLGITIFLTDAAQQDAYEEVFVRGDSLRGEIEAFLRQQGAEAPGTLSISVTFQVKEASGPGSGLSIDWQRKQDSERGKVPGAEAPGITLTALTGDAETQVLATANRRIQLGRCREVPDVAGRLVRRNDFVFVDRQDGPNATVSRAHAFLAFDSAEGAYRLCDEESSHGTALLRDGRLIHVPSGVRGVLIQEGDEIYLGQARIGVQLGAEK